ncbi:MAG TPA: prepilin-type N-terminal cleavage/methylation domain-containing protein [Burkholderiales bacterium]|nr:prepilin-type N-terminal cleavage/methylation domain-containing protein [Burkholderiales bacterium]
MKTGQSNMKLQKGFTLVEIAIVLVIIGLLLGGVLKGQELINSAKVKNFANDFRNVPLYIYAYQDKFRALPGDDTNVTTHVTGSTEATTPGTTGNGNIEGNWDSQTATDESALFWQHVRLAGLTTGGTSPATDGYYPTNADGGRVGVESRASDFISGLNGAYLVCSTGIQGKFAKQLDVTMDDGVHNTGSMQIVATNHTRGQAAGNGVPADDTTYTVCMAL